MNITGIILISWLFFGPFGCQTSDESGVKLVGGAPAGSRQEFASVMIWTSSDATLVQSYCTGTKIAPNLILTAAHCVLVQTPRRGEVYLGPWNDVPSIQSGGVINYSFARDLANPEAAQYKLRLESLHLPGLVGRCLRTPEISRNDCENRTPHPDVAVLQVAPPANSDFDLAPVTTIGFRQVHAGQDIYILGYGSEGQGSLRRPRLKYQEVRVARRDELRNALQATYAREDGYPDFQIFFGTLGPLVNRQAANLGSGDSGGPVISVAQGSIVGVNSDGYCPIGNRDCQRTSNSIFARLNKGGAHGVGEWLERIIATFGRDGGR